MKIQNIRCYKTITCENIKGRTSRQNLTILSTRQHGFYIPVELKNTSDKWERIVRTLCPSCERPKTISRNLSRHPLADPRQANLELLHARRLECENSNKIELPIDDSTAHPPEQKRPGIPLEESPAVGGLTMGVVLTTRIRHSCRPRNNHPSSGGQELGCS